MYPDDDGMYAVHGRLDPEVGALLMRAIEAASDALVRSGVAVQAADGGVHAANGGDRGSAARPGESGHAGTDPVAALSPEQLRADAIAMVAERALAAGFSDGPVSGTRAERYQVVLHVEEGALRGARRPRTSPARATAEDVSAETSARTARADHDARPSVEAAPPPSRLDDGVRVSAETSRRLACDGSVVEVRRAAGGGTFVDRLFGGSDSPVSTVLSVGRRTRTIPPALRRALDIRDGGCRYPGCGSRFTDGHHIEHWADGGETRLENLVLLCRRHHRLVHEGRARICLGADDAVVFYARDGTVVYDAPPARGAREGFREDGGGRDVVGEHGMKDRDSSGIPGARPPRSVLPRLDLPSHRTGAARWARDRDVPIRIEDRALRAVERAAGWA